MIPSSIRWRLPLSYAAIALVAALALGAVLLTTLDNYYTQLERDYLEASTHSIARRIGRIIHWNDPPEDIELRLLPIAALSQTRVRVLDADGQVIADSGHPRQAQLIPAPILLADDSVPLQDVTAPNEGPWPYSVMGIFVPPDPPYENWSSPNDGGNSPSITFSAAEGSFVELNADGQPAITIPVGGSPYGISFSEVTQPANRVSDQTVRAAFYNNSDGTLVGYVELLEGPAYGRDIIDSVANGWVLAGLVAVWLAAGVGWIVSRQISGPLLALTDVTGRMAQGNLSIRANVDQKGEVGQLAASFNNMAVQVENTVYALRRFVADAAHELHTPLTSLQTNLELIIDETDRDRQITFTNRAREQTRRLEALTNGLLELSRIEARLDPEPHTPTDIRIVLQESSELYASWADQADLKLELVLPETPLIVPANESQLQRALHNLLDNAIKYTPEGGSITLGLRQVMNAAEIWVADTGPGIPIEDLPQLFGRFHRGRNAAEYPGNGLGLAIVKTIAEGHHGRVRAENTPDGACFTLTLPLDTSQNRIQPPQS